jgi:hypothetical protein
LDGACGRRPNRPKTFARYHTIPQKVTTVSIYAKGPRHLEGYPDPADKENGPRLAKLGGACCKEVVSAPRILARLPLSYRNTDGAAFRSPRAPKEHNVGRGRQQEGLARIIHERSGGLRFARGKADEDPSKAAKSPHIDSDRSKSRSPYSSTKLGFVNNPG